MRRRKKAQKDAPPVGKGHVAVLVDGDNVPPDVLGPVVEHAQSLGDITERRVFRNWRSTRDSQAWDRESKRHAFERVDRYKTTEGKNSSDIAVAIEAMDLFWSGIRRFVIVSGDTDFAPLVDRLRRGSAHVTVVGHHKDPGLLEEISDRYLRWRDLAPRATSSAARPPSTRGSASSKDQTRPSAPASGKGAGRPSAPPRAASGRGPTSGQEAALETALVDAYEVALTDGDVDADGWCPISRLGQIARDVDAGFSPAKYGLGARTPMYKMVQRFDRFEVDRKGRGRGAQYRVRLLRR